MSIGIYAGDDFDVCLLMMEIARLKGSPQTYRSGE